MNVLITGGAGFLGRHFSKWLLDRGHSVTIIDDLSTGLDLPKWPQITRSKVDEPFIMIGDMREILPRLNRAKFDLAIHLAAVVGGREAIEGKPILGAESIELDSIFFRWAVKSKIPKVIYMSSAAAYPVYYQCKINNTTNHIRKLSEDLLDVTDKYFNIGMPDYIYGWAKVNGEKIAQVMSEKYNLKVHIPRPFSGYGEDQEMVYPMPAICQRVVNKENPFIVWGSGNQARDFIHVDDLIEGIMIRILNFNEKNFDVVNYGTGKATSFKDLAKLGNKLVGNLETEIKCLTNKPEGVYYRVADITNMQKFFIPKISLEEGMMRVIGYLKK